MSSQVAMRSTCHPAIRRASAAHASSVRAAVALLVVAVSASGCNQVVKNTNDTTPPQIEIQVKGANGQYAPASTATLSAAGAGELDWMCTIRDADGVRSGVINYSGSLDGCTVQSAVYDCTATYQPQPQPLSQQYAPDANNKVPDMLPLMATVKGPFSCSCLGPGTGVPYGRHITATCSGSNWSSDPNKSTASKTLTIQLQ